MPNISVYLKDKTLKAVKARAKTEKMPLSSIIREAVEEYLDIADSKEARERVFKKLIKAKPLKNWDTLHEERTTADACRN